MSFLGGFLKFYCVIFERDLGGRQRHHVSVLEGGQACTESIADVIPAVGRHLAPSVFNSSPARDFNHEDAVCGYSLPN